MFMLAFDFLLASRSGHLSFQQQHNSAWLEAESGLIIGVQLFVELVVVGGAFGIMGTLWLLGGCAVE